MKYFISLALSIVLVGCAGQNSKNRNDNVLGTDSLKVSRSELTTAIRHYNVSFKECYEKRTKVGKSGRFNFKWTIQPDGNVTDLICDLNTFKDQDFEKCMSEVLLSVKYPSKEGSTQVEYPMIFQGND